MRIAVVFLLAISAGLSEAGLNRRDLNGGGKEPVLDVEKEHILGGEKEPPSLTDYSDILPGTVVSYADGTPIPGLAESWNLSLSSEPLIVNGKAAEKGKQPYLVSIQKIRDNYAIHICGGSLIAPNKVLTAAHCLADFSKYAFVAALGYYQLSLGLKNPGSQRIQITFAQLHGGYRNDESTGWPNDIAVLTLKTNAKLSSYVQLVELSCFGPWDLDEETVSLRSWGRTSQNGAKSDILQTASFKVISKNKCKESWGSSSIRFEHFCVSDPTVGTCTADSGSPVMYDGKQVGIVSWGSQVCEPGQPSVFQNVQAHMLFLEKFDL